MFKEYGNITNIDSSDTDDDNTDDDNTNDDNMTEYDDNYELDEVALILRDEQEDPFEFQREVPYGLQYDPIINRLIIRESDEILEENKEHEEEEEKDSIS